MITIKINNDNVDICTVNLDTNETGCTADERKLLLSVATALCSEYKEGAEWITPQKALVKEKLEQLIK